MKNPIFLLGLPRTGSTLWLNIFAQNPKIYRMGEMHFLTPWRKDFRYFLKKQVGDLSNGENVKKMIDLLFSRKAIPGITGAFWYYDIDKVNEPKFKEILYTKIIKSDRSLGSLFKIIVEGILHFKGYSQFCMKFPVFINHIPELLQWYPECKIIQIIRDPRALAISRTNDPAGTARKIKKYPYLKFFIRKTMILFVTIQYVWSSLIHTKYKKLKNYTLFRYEDLLTNPEETIKRLCEFTEINFNPQMLNPKKGQASSITGKKQNGFNKNSASNWRRVITRFEEKIITILTKNSMKRFGFDHENHPVYQIQSKE